MFFEREKHTDDYQQFAGNNKDPHVPREYVEFGKTQDGLTVERSRLYAADLPEGSSGNSRFLHSGIFDFQGSFGGTSYSYEQRTGSIWIHTDKIT